MENPKVDAVIGLHEGCLLPITQGKIGVKSGAIMASADVFELYVNGKGARGATPHLSHDPIVVACEIRTWTLKRIISRNKSAFKCSFNNWKNKWRNGTK